MKKGHIYYRCQTRGCPTKTVREERMEKFILNSFGKLKLHPIEEEILNELLDQSQCN